MSTFAKTMLLWTIFFPIATTAIIIVIDYFRGGTIEMGYYLPFLLGFAVSGIVIGFSMYNVQKLKEE